MKPLQTFTKKFCSKFSFTSFDWWRVPFDRLNRNWLAISRDFGIIFLPYRLIEQKFRLIENTEFWFVISRLPHHWALTIDPHLRLMGQRMCKECDSCTTFGWCVCEWVLYLFFHVLGVAINYWFLRCDWPIFNLFYYLIN